MNTVYPRTSSLATVSLIFGILSYVILPFIGAIVAVICGHMARSEIRRAPPGSIDGDGMAVAGLVLGYIQIALSILAVVAFILFFVGLAALGLSASH